MTTRHPPLADGTPRRQVTASLADVPDGDLPGAVRDWRRPTGSDRPIEVLHE